MKKAIIIGATSGIGRTLANILSNNDYIIGLVGRRTFLLEEVKLQLKNDSYVKTIDISKTNEAIQLLNQLILDMNGVDLIVVSAGVGYINEDLLYNLEQEIIDVNVSGFTSMADVAINYFIKKGNGHFVGISSIASIRGNGYAPAYNASKAYVSNYIEGLRHKITKIKEPITITEVQPGFVDTDLAKGEGLFWVAKKEKAGEQIYKAIKGRKNHVYITKRWRLIAWILKILPRFIYNKM